MPKVVHPFVSFQYDGTNGSSISSAVSMITFVSDNGTTFVYKDKDNVNRSVSLNEWVIDFGDGYPGIMSTGQYTSYYVELSSGVSLSMGYALTPNILGSGGTANVAVDLDSAMSGTGYQASAVLAGTSTLLASLVITAVTITDADTVTITVQNNGLVALAGATVIVTAAELAD